MSTVTRIECVWDEILVTSDGFGAAMWEKCAQSQEFGIFGPWRAGGEGGSVNREPGSKKNKFSELGSHLGFG